MAFDLPLDHTAHLSLTVVDSKGNPISPQPAFDAPPSWTDTTPATETLAASADGLTVTLTPLVVGADTVSVSCAVGGKSFTASLDVSVSAAAPAGIVINATLT